MQNIFVKKPGNIKIIRDSISRKWQLSPKREPFCGHNLPKGSNFWKQKKVLSFGKMVHFVSTISDHKELKKNFYVGNFWF